MNTRHLLVASVIAASAMAAAASAAWAVKSPAILAGLSTSVQFSTASIGESRVASANAGSALVATHR